jgi:hypothetical protein
MITVIIGHSRFALEDLSEGWLTEQIVRRRRDGQSVCVRVEIQTPRANMTLATPGCAGPGGGRLPTAVESRIFDLWDQLKLNTAAFSPGNLIAFLKRATDYL